MKNTTRILVSIILVLAMSLSVFAVLPGYGEEYTNQETRTYDEKFKDVSKTYWAFEYIAEMEYRGILGGYPNGYFYPDNKVTRAEFAKIMCLAAGLTVSPITSTSYEDVAAADWYAPYIECGRYYLSGYVSNGLRYYKPNDNALREDIAVALVKLKGYDTSVYDESILKAMFNDYQSISIGARKYVSVAVEQGLISGYEDHTFRGQNSITRAEAATLLWRAYQFGNSNKDFENEEVDIPVKPNEPVKPAEPVKEDPKPEAVINIFPERNDIVIDEGTALDISITISDSEYKDGIKTNPSISDSSIFKTAVPKTSTSNGETTFTWTISNTADIGHYMITFEYRGKKSIFIISINEIKYSYELSTVVSNISNINQIVATNDGFIYWDKNIMEVIIGDNTPICVFEPSELGYIGDLELSKSKLASFKYSIYGITHNKTNKKTYALITAVTTTSDDNIYLYCLEDEECVMKFIEPSSLIYKNNNITYTDSNELYIDQKLIENGSRPVFTWRDTDKCIITSKNIFKFSFGYNHLYSYLGKYNNRTGEFDSIDYYVPGPGAGNVIGINEHFIYVRNYENIYLLDENGDVQKTITADDIDNVDGKPIKLNKIDPRTCAISDDGTIYYLDTDIKCIRMLKPVKLID